MEQYPGLEYQPLFEFLQKEHGLVLTITEMVDILEVCRKIDTVPAHQPEGPWKIEIKHSVSDTEAGKEYDDWIELTDGKRVFFVEGGVDDNDEQKLADLLNRLKLKIRPDDGQWAAETELSYVKEQLKALQTEVKEFAEWCKMNPYNYIRGIGWEHQVTKRLFTTAELHIIFKQA